MPRKLILVLVSLCATSMCFAVPPESADACLKGQIADHSGVAVANAAISVKLMGAVKPLDSVKQTEGAGLRQTFSDGAGQFQVCGLAPGSYQVAVERAGFAAEVRQETLDGQADRLLSIQLDRASAPRRGDSTVTQPVLADLTGVATQSTGLVNEFQYAAELALPDALPDSPTVARPKPGALHGKVNAFWGSGLVGQRDVVLPEQFPLSQFGASVGGDIGSPRTSYFAAVDRYGMDPQQLLASAAAAQARSGKSLLTANSDYVTVNSLEARVDHRFSQHDTAYARLSAGTASDRKVLPGLGGKTPTLGDERKITQVSATVANSVDLSPNSVNQTSAQVILNEAQLPAGAQQAGVESGLPTTRRDRIYEAASNVYRQVGGQSLRYGGDFLYNQMNLSFLESSLGRTSAGDSSFSQSGRSGGLYVQSERRVLPNLLLTSGIRYNIQPLKGFKTDANNLAPQVGFAWSPSARTVIRGGGGIYYDRISSPAIAGSADAGTAANLQNSGTFTSRTGSQAAQLTSFNTLSPTIQNTYVEQSNLQVDQQLSAHTVLSAATQYARGVQVASPVFRATALCLSASACSQGNTLQGSEQGTGAISTYQAVSVALTQEPVRWGNYKIAYTASKAEGSGTDGNTSFINDDMRRVSFTGVLHTSPEAGVGMWQRISRGFMLSGTEDYTNRSEFAGMTFINLNARLTKTLVWGQHYRLEALAETFNSLEKTNAAFAKSAAGMGDRMASVYSTYKLIGSLQGPTGTQFGLRMGF